MFRFGQELAKFIGRIEDVVARRRGECVMQLDEHFELFFETSFSLSFSDVTVRGHFRPGKTGRRLAAGSKTGASHGGVEFIFL